MILNRLPPQAGQIAEDQGWNAESVALHLLSLIRQAVPDWESAVDSHFGEAADEENGTDETDPPDDEE